jgi:MSHA biogenesis protein MshJ
MKVLYQQWNRLCRWYAALSQRERLFVALALVLGPLLIGNALFVDPQWSRSKAMQNTIATDSTSLAAMQAQAASLQQELSNDPDAGNKAELAALIAQRDQLDEQLHQQGLTLVRPEDMNGLLERLLVRQSGLRLISLKTQAPQSVLREKEAAKETDGKAVERSFDLYRHGVEIRLEGSYSQLQAYLAQLEKLPQRLLWGQLSYRVIDYPRSEMTLVVYTLSPDKTWLTL